MIAVGLNTRYALMMAALLTASAAGLLFLWMLFVAWRRAMARRRRRADRAVNGADLWQASGDRLVSKINQLLYEDHPPTAREDETRADGNDYSSENNDFENDQDDEDEEDDERPGR